MTTVKQSVIIMQLIGESSKKNGQVEAKNKIVILGAGESGVGAAYLAQQQGYEVFVSDFGADC